MAEKRGNLNDNVMEWMAGVQNLHSITDELGNKVGNGFSGRATIKVMV